MGLSGVGQGEGLGGGWLSLTELFGNICPKRTGTEGHGMAFSGHFRTQDIHSLIHPEMKSLLCARNFSKQLGKSQQHVKALELHSVGEEQEKCKPERGVGNR